MVREINHSTGDISTFAGNGTYGYSGDGGLATSAELEEPWGIAVDSSGNVYVSDVAGQVREVNHSTGDISTFAGQATSGSSGDGGPATSAKLHGPRQIALDSSGNLYIADAANNVIREVTASTGIINSLATGTGFSQDYGVAVDSSGNVYVGDTNHNLDKLISSTEPPIGFSSPTLSFAETSVDRTSTPQTITVTNTGSSTLSISSDALSGANSADFFITSNTCSGASLTTGQTCKVSINFLPSIMGPLSADLTFSDGISSGLTPTFVYLTGKGGGYVSDFAGIGAYGSTGDGGPAISAEVAGPEAVALDSSGNLSQFQETRSVRSLLQPV